MTMIGWLGHELPYLISDFWITNLVAFIVCLSNYGCPRRSKAGTGKSRFCAAFQLMLDGSLIFVIGSG